MTTDDLAYAAWLQEGRRRGWLARADALAVALLRADSYLSLLRGWAGITSWGKVGMCEQRDVDEVIGQARAALAAYREDGP